VPAKEGVIAGFHQGDEDPFIPPAEARIPRRDGFKAESIHVTQPRRTVAAQAVEYAQVGGIKLA
jgi:hypothetical protein